jgi:hypothetical protein
MVIFKVGRTSAQKTLCLKVFDCRKDRFPALGPILKFPGGKSFCAEEKSRAIVPNHSHLIFRLVEKQKISRSVGIAFCNRNTMSAHAINSTAKTHGLVNNTNCSSRRQSQHLHTPERGSAAHEFCQKVCITKFKCEMANSCNTKCF